MDPPASTGGGEKPANARPRLKSGSIAIGAAVAALTLVVYQWVLVAAGTPPRMFLPAAVLVAAQAVFNGVVLAGCAASLQQAESAGRVVVREVALRQVSVVLVGALFAMSGILPLMITRFYGGKSSETEMVLAIGGLLAATILAIVVAPVLYALAIRRGE
jgi:Cu/Ag efflux pump CusA